MRGGASRVPFVATTLAVLLLLVVVAVASSGSTPAGSGETRPPADVVFDTILSLGLVLLVPAAALVIYGLAVRKVWVLRVTPGRQRRVAVLVFVALALLYATAISYAIHRYEPRPFAFDLAEQDFTDSGADGPSGPEDARARGPEFAWIPVLVVLGLAAAGIAASVLGDRRRRKALPGTDRAAVEQVADAINESLDDLRSEPDARRAVIAAYARLERVLAASGLPRRLQETPEEYVPRILDGLEVDARPIRSLTDLYTLAKFSHHEVTQEMKQQAISALEQIRDALRAAARRRDEEREETLTRYERAAAQ